MSRAAGRPCFGVVSVFVTGNQRAKLFFSALLVAGAALGKAWVFPCLFSAILKQE